MRTITLALGLSSLALVLFACGGGDENTGGAGGGSGGGTTSSTTTTTTTSSTSSGTSQQVGSIDIVPATDFCNDCSQIPRGKTRQFKAIVRDFQNEEIDVPVAFSTADTTIATVATDGTVTAVKLGETDLLAQAGGITGTLHLTVVVPTPSRIEVLPGTATVTAAGATQTFEARGYDENDVLIPDLPFLWASSNGAVATFADPTKGVATAQGKGLTAIGATVNQFLYGWATLTVGNAGDVIPPTTPFQFATMAGNTAHACGIDAQGAAYCWGGNFFGELGDGTTLGEGVVRSSPGKVAGNLTFSTIATGYFHTCALTPNGEAYCWGAQEAGALGNGMSAPDAVKTPAAVSGNHLFKTIRAGNGFTCALDQQGKIHCWGSNLNGNLGDGSFTDHAEPQEVPLDGTFVDLVTGLWHACALRDDGKAFCWGATDEGALGDGSAPGAPNPSPVEVAGNHVFTRLSSYGSHVCAITDQGEVWCWGRNDFHQVSSAPDLAVNTPVQIATPASIVDLAAGAFHTCLLTSAGAAHCWGNNDYGQLGDATLQSSTSVTDVAGGLVLKSLFAGSHHTCGLTATGGAYCWGSSSAGQLGSGFGGLDTDLSPVPWPVAQPQP